VSAHVPDAHERWDELAAGYALDALEPDEELAFTEHLRGCDLCARLLDEHSFVAAQLGSLGVGSDDAHVPEWGSIRSNVVGPAGTRSLTPLSARRTVGRLPRLLAAAAAVLVLAGVALVGWQATQPSSSAGTRAISACAHRSGCSVVRLRAAHGAVPAVVLVDDGRATLVPMAMTPPAVNRTYVLWQVLRKGGPAAVSSFRDTKHDTSSSLATPYADTAAFAVSLEPAGAPPSQPSDVLAIGNTTA